MFYDIQNLDTKKRYKNETLTCTEFHAGNNCRVDDIDRKLR